MSTDRSLGGKKFVKFLQPNDPPPEDPYFGGSFNYIEGGRTSKRRHRGYRPKEEDEGSEEDGPTIAAIAKERRKDRELDAVSIEATAGDHREQTKRAAPQAPIPPPGLRGARRENGSGHSDLVSYAMDRRTANQPQPSEARQRSGELASSLALELYHGPTSRKASSSVRRKHAPPAGDPSVGNSKSPPPQRRDSKSNPEPRKTPSPDNRGRVQAREQFRKRVLNPPSLAGFSRFICHPWRAMKPIDLAPPRSESEMSGALGFPPSVKGRGKSVIKRERLASNSDVVRSEHQSNRHSDKSNGSRGPTQRQGPTVKVEQNAPAMSKERRGSRG